jgi:3-deoxy-D-manno-octulosonate 8-phosphate phosphatase (KDO 8-P phosphatase)
MINYDLKKIKAIAFDVDGVLSSNLVTLDGNAQPVRTANIKDGYAMQLAVKKGLNLAIITGGKSEAVRQRYIGLGLQNVFLAVSVKIDVFNQWLEESELNPEEVIYMGDDIPDYEVMKICGCACCPSDAAPEIKAISTYVSPYSGGYGCCRDVIEQVLKAQGLWMSDAQAFGW